MFCSHHELIERSWKSHAMNSPFSESPYKSVQQALMSKEDDEVFRIECSEEQPKSFVWFVQIFSGKAATTLKSTAFVANPVHVGLVKVSSS